MKLLISFKWDLPFLKKNGFQKNIRSLKYLYCDFKNKIPWICQVECECQADF